MDGSACFEASVPVYRRYLDRIDGILDRLGDVADDLLSARLIEGTFTAGEHLRTAQGYVLRCVCPLAGRDIPTLSTEGTTADALRLRSAEVRQVLDGMAVADFADAPFRQIAHKAGNATLDQDGVSFLTLYALPNFFFHLTMGYATLRGQGAEIGKADFDGFHDYPRGFSF